MKSQGEKGTLEDKSAVKLQGEKGVSSFESDSLELLMPAGSLEKLQFAFAYGADAVYAGAPFFSLRARENGFNKETLKEGISYAHALGKKIYITMNIFAHNNKVEGFLDSFLEMYELKPDAFIMSDVGLIKKALSLRPDVTIHLSTQANAVNWTDVEFWKELGVKRIILSRELSLTEIREIREKVAQIELEAFVHGAICISYSGRCLISNYLNHRDSNQGTCTNSCRWHYKLGLERASIRSVEDELAASSPTAYTPLAGSYYLKEQKREDEPFPIDEDEYGTYLMNSKDLCAIEFLQELQQAGVCSFKVEGRTKSIYYLAITTRAYRRAIDDLLQNKPFDKDNLLELFATSSRTFTTGFLARNPRGYGENFCDGESLPLTHKFAARVLEYDPNTEMALLDVRNKISLGDTLEWITPQESVAADLTEIIDKNGKPLSAASGGCYVRIKSPVNADKFTLLRKRL